MGVHPPLGGFPAVDVEEEAHVGFQGQSVVGPEVEAGEIVFPGTLPDLVDAHPHDLQIQAGVPEAGEAADEFFVVQILEVVAAVEDGGMEAIADAYHGEAAVVFHGDVGVFLILQLGLEEGVLLLPLFPCFLALPLLLVAEEGLQVKVGDPGIDGQVSMGKGDGGGVQAPFLRGLPGAEPGLWLGEEFLEAAVLPEDGHLADDSPRAASIDVLQGHPMPPWRQGLRGLRLVGEDALFGVGGAGGVGHLLPVHPEGASVVQVIVESDLFCVLGNLHLGPEIAGFLEALLVWFGVVEPEGARGCCLGCGEEEGEEQQQGQRACGGHGWVVFLWG